MRALTLGLLGSIVVSYPAVAAKACAVKDADGMCLSQASAEPIFAFKRGMPYAEVRKALMSRGTYRNEMPLTDPEQRCSIGRDECKAFDETIYCSGTGKATCEFMFSRGRNYYAVRTYGEEPRYEGARYLSDAEIKELMTIPGAVQ